MTSYHTDHREAAVQILRTLTEAGQTAYLAGGCVRDRLLGRIPKDYDVATDAPPDLVGRLFPNCRHVGEAFGVVLVPVRCRRRRYMIEVATFRTEGAYQDGRHPSQVEFTDAQHDATRRDFTINGLFENPLEDMPQKQIIDFVRGQADLASGQIRAIGDANKRFGEDFLRMLRAVRFAARFGFTIETATAAAIRRHAGNLARISRERIGQELLAMLTPDHDAAPATAVHLTQAMHLDGAVLNEDHRDPPLPTIEVLGAQAHYPTVLAAWMMDRHWPTADLDRSNADVDTAVNRWRAALCLSNAHYDELRQVLYLLRRATVWPALSIAARKRLLAEPLWQQAFTLLKATAPPRQLTALGEQIDRETQPLIADQIEPAPLVNGDDLIALGHEPGPKFSRLLEAVYDEQLEGRVRNRAEALDWLGQQY